MLRSEKQRFVNDLQSIYNQYHGVFITHYHGMSSQEMFCLRSTLKNSDVGFKVVKNTLNIIAAKNVSLDLSHMLKGPVAIAYSSDFICAAKLINTFANKNKNFKIVGGVVEGKVVNFADVVVIAKLPSLSEIRTKLASIIQVPASSLVRLVQAPASNIVHILNSYSNQ